MEILRVTISVNKTAKFDVKSIEIDRETEKQYRTKMNSIISKEKMLIPNTLYRNSISNSTPYISYECYCHLEDELKAKSILQEKALEKIIELTEGALSLSDSIGGLKIN